MYIDYLTSWTKGDWENFFSRFDFTYRERLFIQDILTLENKEDIEESFDALKGFGIINGIGPGKLGSFFRSIITFFFYGVKYEWHDIHYSLGGDDILRSRADAGLLKYSQETLDSRKKSIYNFECGPLEKLLYIITYWLFFPIQSFIAWFCYGMVHFFGKSAYNYH